MGILRPFAHTTAISPERAFRRRNMRAKLSGKNVLRLGGLLGVFVLAVALAVSAFSFTRTGASDNVAYAATNVKPTVNVEGEDKEIDYAEAINVSREEWSWSVPLDGTPDSNGNLATFTYVPSTYINYYGYLSGNHPGISNLERTDTKAYMKPLVYNETIRLHAYYELPNWLIDAGATIEFSANLDTAVTSYRLGSVNKYICMSNAISTSPTNAGGSPSKVTSENRYLMVVASGIPDNLGNFTTAWLQISNLRITIKIKSVDNFEALISNLDTKVPVTAAWNGSTQYSISNFDSYNNIANLFNTDNNIVGNLDPAWSLKDGDSNVQGTPPTINSLRTDGVFQKQFSFLLYDKFMGLDTANINGFDIMSAYTSGTVTDGSAYSYKRADFTAEELKTLFYPKGAKQIDVRPFAYADNNPSTGLFRGLYVTVYYDGLDNSGNAIETDTVFKVSYTNLRGASGRALSVVAGGLDYTVPDALSETSIITENIEKDGVVWFYKNTIDFKPYLSDTDVRGDVYYYFTLYSKNEAGEYVDAVPGYENVRISDPGKTVITLNGLDVGYYAIRYKAIDTLGRFYEASDVSTLNEAQLGFANHIVYSDYNEFAVDNPALPEKWENNVLVVDSNGASALYNGEWTNKPIVITFNTLASLAEVKMEYSYQGYVDGVLTSADSKDYTPLVLSDNRFVISRDETRPEGFERVYYFRATFASGLEYNFSVSVKFDDFAEYAPVSATLLDYTNSGVCYADLLPLNAELNYMVGTEPVSDFKGSPMKLYYQIMRNGINYDAAKEISLDSNVAAIDLFGGKNVYGTTTVTVRMWFEDEAGNINHETVYNVNLDRAKLNVRFAINALAKKYYGNNDVVPENLVSYTVDNVHSGTISQKDIRLAYAARYDGVDAGVRNVLVSGVLLSAVSEKYASVLDEYELVYFDNDGNVIPVAENGVIGTHEIRKARLKLNDTYRFSDVYNGSGRYAVAKTGAATSLVPIDVVDGDKADEWKTLEWSGVVILSITKAGENIKSTIGEIVVYNDALGNYQITNDSGNNNNPSVYADIAKRDVSVIITATKVYDGTDSFTMRGDNCTVQIIGKQGNDDIYINTGAVFTLSGAGVGVYNLDVSGLVLKGSKADNYTYDGTAKVSIEITAKPITVSVDNVMKTFDNSQFFAVNAYKFHGVVDGDEVLLVSAEGKTDGVNVGTYKNCLVKISLAGADSANYMLEQTEATVNVTVTQLTVGGAVIEGIYAIDNKHNYYYRYVNGDNEVVYQKNDDGTFTAYSREGSSVVDSLPEGATRWVLTSFVKGGVRILNSHRFELADEIIYAIRYYEDSACTVELNMGEMDYTMREYQPTVLQTNGKDFGINIAAGTYDIEVKALKGNFAKKEGFSTNVVSVQVYDFDDIVFDGKIYNAAAGEITGNTAIFNGNPYTLKIKWNPDKGAITSQTFKYYNKVGAEWVEVESAVNAGTYKAVVTVVRGGNEYIVEKEFVVNKVNTSIDIKDRTTDFKAEYGKNFVSSVEKYSNFDYAHMGMLINAGDIVFEYAYDKDFTNTLSSAPVRLGGGTYYVRVRYNGNDNFIGSVSEPRKIVISGATFGMNDFDVCNDESFELPSVSDFIDEKYKDYASDFVIVYYVNGQYRTVGNKDVFSNPGKYDFMIVRKTRVADGKLLDSGKFKNAAEYACAVAATSGNTSASLIVRISSLDSVNGGENNIPAEIEGELNGNGSISGRLPVVSDGYELWFSIMNKTNAANVNFTNGLMANSDSLGGKYAADKVFLVKLSAYLTEGFGFKDKELDEQATVTLNVGEMPASAKLVRYSDGTFTTIDYVDNGDGTISFETDKLGYFIVTSDYVEETTGGNNVLAIGIGAGVGGAAAIAIIAIVIGVVVKKKRA